MSTVSKSSLGILDYLNDSVFIHTFDGTILEVNKTASEQLGYSVEELRGMNIRDLDTPEFAALIQERIEEFKQKERLIFESAHKRKDGSVVPVEVSIRPISYDNTPCIISVVRDITARKLMEKSLQDSEARFRAIAENISDVVWIVDFHFEFIYISPAVEQVLGFTLEEYLKRRVDERYPPEVLQDMYVKLLEELENEKNPNIDKNRTRVIEIQEYRKDGSLADLSVHVKFLRDESGKPNAIIGVSRDVTEKKKAEKEIQRYKLIFEQSLNEIYLFDSKTLKFMYVNHAALNNLGYSFEEMSQMTPVDIKPEFTFETFNKKIEPLKKGTNKKIVFETVHKRKNGSVYNVEVHLQLVKHDGEEYFAAIILDITERKKIEAALKESEEKFRILAESTPMAIIMYQDDKWIYANPAAERITGYTKEELYQMNFWDIIHPDEQELVKERGRKRQRGEHVTPSYEFRIVDKSGLVKWVFITGASVIYKGRTAGLLSVLDITEKKKDEEEKKKLQEQLLQSQKMEAIGTLAGGVAHEFNNMLNIIAGHAELALINIPNDSPARQDVEEIKKAAQRSAEITKKLLTFARKHEDAYTTINLNETIDAIIGMLQRLIGENIQLIWKPLKKELLVKIDPLSIDQILVNLCVNARDAISNHGNITIRTSVVNLDEVMALQNGVFPGDYAVIDVSDTGQGMDDETLQHIFDPFFTTKAVGKGTGLGLSTVYGIVKNNGGFIKVRSDKGKGSTFSIYLPLFIERKEFAPYYDEAIMTLYRGTETILLVEDEVSILNMTRKMLENLGYTVLPTSDPFEALEIAKKYAGTIHLLFTDVVMPKMNGVDLSKLITALHPSIKVIYTSGYPAEILSQHNFKPNTVNYLPKPVSFAVLASAIRTILES
ncbi:MAG: PAS domain S-box protein [Spirochaetes bacterium]|nr:PAS domain S-box protein [Spirochaetota bacterium]